MQELFFSFHSVGSGDQILFTSFGVSTTELSRSPADLEHLIVLLHQRSQSRTGFV